MVLKQRSNWIVLGGSLSVMAALSVACGISVDGTGNANGGDEGIEDGKKSAVCLATDEAMVERHTAWQETDNDFGELAKTKWVGFFGQPGNQQTPLDLELVIESVTEGTLQVGPRAKSVVKDEGMLEPAPDGSLLEPLYYSGNYDLRGVGFANGELTAFLPLSAPFDAWCALQTPYSYTPDNPEYCEFGATPNEGVLVGSGGSPCHLYPSGTEVDCAWLWQGEEHCACTSSECFANVDFPDLREWETFEDYAEQGVAIRLTLDETQGLLSGVGLWKGSEYHLELARTF